MVLTVLLRRASRLNHGHFYVARNLNLNRRSISLGRQIPLSAGCVCNQLQTPDGLPEKVSKKLKGNTVRVGCASGFWGDTSVAAPQLVHHGRLDFLVFDYLSEITMSLLAAAKQKSPDFGYTPDFVDYSMQPLLKEIKSKGIRVISNAGGINPNACAEALRKACEKESVDLKIAVVTGDDMMAQMAKVKEMCQASGTALPPGIHSMNAYLGAGPIVKALDLGADIVITGRCVDSALTLAPLMHSFRWAVDDFDLLANGSLAGHLVECGAQVTGGIFTDWETVPDWETIGFPIVECASDGVFVVTKPPNTGGVVNRATVAEQLVYEIGDPKNYLLPDVICDFSDVRVEPFVDYDNTIAVLVSGAKGKRPSDSYKVSATFIDGFRAITVCPVIGPHASQKARRVAESIIKRCSSIFKSMGFEDFSATNVEVLGAEHNYGHNASFESLDMGPREVILWLGVQHKQKKALEIFSREIAPAGTGMAPGLTTLVGGRPKVSPVLRLHSLMYPKNQIQVGISIDGKQVECYEPPRLEPTKPPPPVVVESKPRPKVFKQRLLRGSCTFPLGSLAYTRSGDKGNTANIGVVCRNPGYYPFLKKALTAEAVQEYFQHLFDDENSTSKVTRYELPGVSAFNFVLEDALGGGGVASLRSDPQGKALGQMLLDFKVKNVPDLMPSTADRSLDSYSY